MGPIISPVLVHVEDVQPYKPYIISVTGRRRADDYYSFMFRMSETNSMIALARALRDFNDLIPDGEYVCHAILHQSELIPAEPE